MPGPMAGLQGARRSLEGLETILAQRLADQKFALEQRRLDTETDYRNRQLEEQSRLRELETQARIDAQRALQEDKAEGRRLQKVNIALMRPMGSVVSADERAQEIEAGVPSGYYDEEEIQGQQADSGSDNATPISIKQIRFRGKEADRFRREADEARDADRDADREQRLQIAQLIAANQRDGSSQVRVMNITQDGVDKQVLVDGNGRILFGGNSQLPGALKTKRAEYGALIDQIDLIGSFGQQTGWAGTGAIKAPAMGLLKKTTGLGSNAGDQLRIFLDSLRADIAHEKYGAAFTATERSMLSNFAPSSNMDDSAIRNRLWVMRQVIDTRLNQLDKGATIGTGGTPGTATPVRDLLQQLSAAPARTGNTGNTGTGTTPNTTTTPPSTGFRVVGQRPRQ